MKSVGFFLVLLGASSFVFPMMNRRSMILSVFGEHEQIAAIASIVAGVVVLALSFRKKKEAKP